MACCRVSQIPTDPFLRVVGAKPGSLLAIGDAAAIVDGSSSSRSRSGSSGSMNFMNLALGNGNGNGNGNGAPAATAAATAPPPTAANAGATGGVSPAKVQRRPRRAPLPQTAQVPALARSPWVLSAMPSSHLNTSPAPPPPPPSSLNSQNNPLKR
jgi:hypothetical protein